MLLLPLYSFYKKGGGGGAVLDEHFKGKHQKQNLM